MRGTAAAMLAGMSKSPPTIREPRALALADLEHVVGGWIDGDRVSKPPGERTGGPTFPGPKIPVVL